VRVAVVTLQVDDGRIIQAQDFTLMSINALNLFKALHVMYPDVACPVPTGHVFPVWRYSDAPQLLFNVLIIWRESRLAQGSPVFIESLALQLEVVKLTYGGVPTLRVNIDHPTHVSAVSILS